MSTSTTNWSLTNRASHSLEVWLLGCVDFDSAAYLQNRLVYEIAGRSDRMGGLLLCEHPPLITIGRQGCREDVLATRQELASSLIDVRWIGRGGGTVMHQPGQLAAYPIVPLDRLNLGLDAWRTALRETLLDVCREFRVQTVESGCSSEIHSRNGRIATIGSAVKRWVTHQGFFLNVDPDLMSACVVRSKATRGRVSSLAAQRIEPVPMQSVRSAVIEHLSGRLRYDSYHLYTGHPLLNRSTRRVPISSGS